MTCVSRVVLATVLVVAPCAVARADTIGVRGQGWCSSAMCNSTNTATFNNTFAGTHDVNGDWLQYRNWFAFNVPELGPITSAALNIWNDERNITARPSAVFELRDASSVSFGGLAGTTTLGSVNVGDADNGASRYIAINLNGAALNFLNAARGGQFLFGGVVTPFAGSREVQIFGYTGGRPAAFLEFSAEQAPVPEPSTVVLLVTGAAALAARRRRRC